jgi:peptidoglycan/xylan/chitin deacetylase (PgdA/CDA1 family)
MQDNIEKGLELLKICICRRPKEKEQHEKEYEEKTRRIEELKKQLKELDQSGLVTVASQTCSHPADLTKLSISQLMHELQDSKRTLELKLGHPVTAIAYPNGKYNERVAKAAEQADYRIGFTEVTRPAQQRPSIFQVPRYVHTKFQRAWKESFGKS